MWVKGKLSALALIRVEELEMEQSFCEGAAGWGPPFVGVPSFSRASLLLVYLDKCVRWAGKEATTIDYPQAAVHLMDRDN